jgi:tRNA nucleotidyltransferase (CCA-adding enzyme)
VGGAVRDYLLNLPTADRDYVVVGSTPEEMSSLGYIQVGSSFPVFLHPITKEEYALARTEKKSGVGYKGFTVGFSPRVSLERDLYRRDLTINAMAMDSEGVIYDPYGGKKDLEARVLRHVSTSFKEDPLRVLRVMRFMSSLHKFQFTVASETREMMRDLINTGELVHLSGARVLLELKKVFMTPAPYIFFTMMYDYGVYKYVLRSCQNIPRDYYSYFTNWESITHPLETGLALLAYKMSTNQLATLSQDLPLSRIMKFHCAFIQKWLVNLPTIDKEQVDKIISFTRDVKGAYYQDLKVITEQLVDLLQLEVNLTPLWEIYKMLQGYPYNQKITDFKNFTAQKLLIQQELVRQYIATSPLA